MTKAPSKLSELTKKRIWKAVIGFLIFICLYLAVCFGLILCKINDRPMKLTGYQTILVLGSQIDGKNLATSYPAEVTKNRLDAALILAKHNPKAKIIVSGYKGPNENVTEAAAMGKYLEENGLAHNRIIKESKARNTAENIANSKVYFHGKTMLVTSDFHLARGLILADKQHLSELTGFAAPTPERSLGRLTVYYVHETLGIARALILGR